MSDIGVWIECYALMVSVLVAYDRMYRRQVLARGSLDWEVEDPGL